MVLDKMLGSHVIEKWFERSGKALEAWNRGKLKEMYTWVLEADKAWGGSIPV